MKIFFLSLIILAGCADKKYVSVDPVNENSQSLNDMNCTVQFKTSGYCLDWYWEETPVPKKTMGKMIYKVFRKNNVDGSPVLIDTEMTPFVSLFMPSMWHGSRPVVTSKEDVGTYRSEKIFFSMGGDWEIKIQFKENDVVVDEAIISLFF